MLNSGERAPAVPTGSSKYHTLYELAEYAITTVLCVVVLFAFIGRMVTIIGGSMEPTLHHGERLVSSRLYKALAPGDIVVVVKPTSRNEPLIKRVIATGGQTVDIDFDTGDVRIDGALLDEPYISEHIEWTGEGDVQFPQVVPDGCLFLMGDNRNNSWDSRWQDVGMVDENYVLGKVLVRLLPFDQVTFFS